MPADEEIERGVGRPAAVEERGEDERGGRELVGLIEAGAGGGAPGTDRIAGLGIEGGARRLVGVDRAGERPGQSERGDVSDRDRRADPRGAAQVARQESREDRHRRHQRVRLAQRDQQAEQGAAEEIGPRTREEALRPALAGSTGNPRRAGGAPGQRQHEASQGQRHLQGLGHPPGDVGHHDAGGDEGEQGVARLPPRSPSARERPAPAGAPGAARRGSAALRPSRRKGPRKVRRAADRAPASSRRAPARCVRGSTRRALPGGPRPRRGQGRRRRGRSRAPERPPWRRRCLRRRAGRGASARSRNRVANSSTARPASTGIGERRERVREVGRLRHETAASLSQAARGGAGPAPGESGRFRLRPAALYSCKTLVVEPR